MANQPPSKRENNLFGPIKALLWLFLDGDDFLQAIGDFEEAYRYRIAVYGKRRASVWIWWHLFKSLPFFISDFLYWRRVMLKNYLITAFRNMKTNKGYAFINITGLAIGLALCFFVLLWVQNELSYDQYHKNGDRIYRIIIEVKQGESSRYTSYSAPAIGPALKEEFPEVIKATRFRIVSDRKILVRRGKKQMFEDRFGFADPDIFEMLTIPFLVGDPETALSDPDSIVISESYAQRYFGGEDPIGQVLIAEKDHEFKVTGIFRNIPENSHLQFDSLVPFEANMGEFMPIYGNPHTFDIHFFRNYLFLQDGASAEEFGEKIYHYLSTKTDYDNYLITLQPLKKIHLHSSHIRDIVARGNIQYVLIFSLIGLLVMVIACINFISLTTARSGMRTKEVGVRKVVGAAKRDLVRQFFGESLLYMGIACVLASALVFLLLPAFQSLLGKSISFDLEHNWKGLGGLLAVTLGAGLLSGSYPSLFIASIKPVAILKGTPVMRKGKGLFRKVLVVSQFVIAIGLIVCTVVILVQFRFLQQKNLGIDRDHMMYFRLQGDLQERQDVLRAELLKNPNISHMTTTSSIPTSGRYVTTVFNWEGKDPSILTSDSRADYVSVDPHFLETFGLELTQGRNFSPDAIQNKNMQEIIINESTLRMMGLESPLGLGADLTDDNFRARIIGVVKDYHFKSLHTEIGPIVMWVNRAFLRYAFLKVRPENLKETISFVEKTSLEIEPGFPFEYDFLDTAFANLYRSEEQMGKLFNVFTALSIFIACLGLFGLAAFSALCRTKEIGIRKVLGASIPNIIRLISRELVGLVVIANFISWPVVYILMSKWLDNFAYKSELNLWIFIISGLIVLAIALLTVSSQAVKASIADPVEALKCE